MTCDTGNKSAVVIPESFGATAQIGTPSSLSCKSLGRVGAELFTASFVVLFQELTLIRWLPGQVRVLAYFPNLILLSAFLGLGLGCLRAGRRPLIWLWPFSLGLVVAAGFGMSRIAFTQNAATEHLWLLYYDLPANAPVIGDVRLPIVLAFILSALSFVPLGQFVAERLREFRARSSSLWGYSWDILGSLAGVVSFALVCLLRSFPVVWFAVFLSAGFLFVASARRRWVYVFAAGAILLLVSKAERADRYSPYYALRVDPDVNRGIFQILANGSLHQVAVDLKRSGPMGDDWHQSVRAGYHLPYELAGQRPKRVLVLGAGTGNDVAVALDEGAEQVDAVEIDPEILKIGKDIHPDRPYLSARVRVINTDARSFLNESQEKYDLIVFGTLDSMTRLSALSNVRLDNFIYTVDCLEAARTHLAAGGGLVMYFMVATDYIDRRLGGMLTQTFGAPPFTVKRYFELFNRIYMAGPAFAGLAGEERAARAPSALRALLRIELPSDDWPYLYLQRRQIGAFYLELMAIIAVLAVAGVVVASQEMRRSLSSRRRADGEMFFFGLAFLLLETKSVTAMNLAWGATWLTSAVVFGSILAMILLATLITQLRPIPWPVGMAGLIVSLLVAYVAPTQLLLRLDTTMKLGLSVLFVGVPIFFAAVCFALIFRDRDEADLAFGWNLLGAVAGGLLEFLSMAIGIRALSLLALAAYLCALLIRMRAQAASDQAAWQVALPRLHPAGAAPSKPEPGVIGT